MVGGPKTTASARYSTVGNMDNIWRIAGMATREVGSSQGILVDFENAEMLGQLLNRGEPTPEPTSQNPSGQLAQPPSIAAEPSGNPALNTATQPQTGLR